MTDIHCHIMPGIDDGADSYEEALAMANEAYEAGTRVMAATPHYYNESQCRYPSSRGDVISKYKKLRDYLKAAGCPVTLCIGAEHFGVSDIGRLAHENKLIPLNGSRYVLVEFNFDDEPERVRYVLSQLLESSYVPVIAHPERYFFIQQEPARLYRYLDLGCLIQINKGSPLGRYGEDSKELSMWMLRNRLPHIVASDCHSPFQRTPDMGELHEQVSLHISESYADRLFNENPMKILKNQIPD